MAKLDIKDIKRYWWDCWRNCSRILFRRDLTWNEGDWIDIQGCMKYMSGVLSEAYIGIERDELFYILVLSMHWMRRLFLPMENECFPSLHASSKSQVLHQVYIIGLMLGIASYFMMSCILWNDNENNILMWRYKISVKRTWISTTNVIEMHKLLKCDV